MADEKLCKLLLDHHQNWVLELPHVTGIGIISDHSDMDGCVIAVYVDSQITFEALPIAHILPYIMTTIVDDKVVQIPMKIIETGKLNFGLEH